MTVQENKVVTIHYTLKDDAGQVLDSSAENGPLPYLHGTGNIISGLEEALEGKKKGDKLKVVVPPEKAYGTYDPEAVEIVSKAEFDEGEKVEVGSEFQYEDEDGEIHMVKITKIEGDDVTIDENHPLADKTLHFDIEILDIREATEEELDHGHVHDGEGHHHDH